MAKAGEIVRLGRGLYQVVDADFGGDHALAEVAKTVPKGIICLLSALAFHELTDQIPARIWIAIGLKDWKPSPTGTPLRVIRMPGELLRQDVERHTIEGVPVPIFNVLRTLSDCLKYQRIVGLAVAGVAVGAATSNNGANPEAIACAAER